MIDLFELLGKITIDNDKANDGIDETTEKAEESESRISKAFSKIGSVAEKVGIAVSAGLAVASGAIIKIGKDAISAYADFEQLVGGVETLFKDSSDKIIEYANNAYKTAGMSANQYMETVTSFSASLLQSLDGDTEKAVSYADMAITDMSDNANKMCTDIANIQTAYQGFAKQNYSMLDNLKLGYGGTAAEMYRLLQDATALNDNFAKTAEFSLDEKGHLTAGYADIVEAIHIVQTEMDITGTTAKEASTTIQGSISSMKASWQNLLVGLTDETQNFDNLINNFFNSLSTVGDNLIPRISVVLNGITGLVSKLAPKLSSEVPNIVSVLLPKLIEGALLLFNELVSIFPQLLNVLIDNLPVFLDGLIVLINNIMAHSSELVKPILNTLPIIIGQIFEVLPNLINSFFSNLGINIDVTSLFTTLGEAVQLIYNILTDITQNDDAMSFLQGVGTAILAIVAAIKAWNIVQGILNVLLNANPIGIVITAIGLLIAGITLVITYWDEIKAKISDFANWFKEKVVEPISKIFDVFTEYIKKMPEIGLNLIKGIWEGINNAGAWLKEKISGFFGGVVDSIKDFFGIHSPSHLFRDLIGANLVKGIGVGFDVETPNLQDTITKDMTDVTATVKTNVDTSNKSIQDVIKPTYSNDLVYSIKPNIATINSVGSNLSQSNMLENRVNSVETILLNYLPLIVNTLSSLKVYLDKDTLVGEITPDIDSELGRISRLRSRGV